MTIRGNRSDRTLNCNFGRNSGLDSALILWTFLDNSATIILVLQHLPVLQGVFTRFLRDKPETALLPEF